MRSKSSLFCRIKHQSRGALHYCCSLDRVERLLRSRREGLMWWTHLLSSSSATAQLNKSSSSAARQPISCIGGGKRSRWGATSNHGPIRVDITLLCMYLFGGSGGEWSAFLGVWWRVWISRPVLLDVSLQEQLPGLDEVMNTLIGNGVYRNMHRLGVEDSKGGPQKHRAWLGEGPEIQLYASWRQHCRCIISHN